MSLARRSCASSSGVSGTCRTVRVLGSGRSAPCRAAVSASIDQLDKYGSARGPAHRLGGRYQRNCSTVFTLLPVQRSWSAPRRPARQVAHAGRRWGRCPCMFQGAKDSLLLRVLLKFTVVWLCRSALAIAVTTGVASPHHWITSHQMRMQLRNQRKPAQKELANERGQLVQYCKQINCKGDGHEAIRRR